MKSILLAAQLALTASLQGQSPPAETLLDKVISHPGSYSQVCDVMTAPAEIPYRAFELTDFSGAGFSKANLALIAKNRDALVNALRTRLLAIHFSNEAKQPGADPKPEENFDGEAYGCDPQSLNPLLLGLIQQLHAIEALPELLIVEQQLVEQIAKAKDDAKAAPPVVCGWFVAMEGGSDDDETATKRDRRLKLFQSRIAQRDLVMLMALLMREKAYKPYLETTLESAYAKGLKAKARELKLPIPKPGEELPAEIDGCKIEVDPITRLVRREFAPVLIPYTRESRDQVRAAAAKWIAEHP
jgi:hypothetical protein